MKQIDLFAPEVHGDPQLLADRVRFRYFGNGAKVVAEFFDGAAVRFAAEENVLGVRVEARQVPQQVTDVRADAVIPHFAGVDGDSQDTRFYRGS